jgi:methylglutaconyl-CoA hydratase
MIDVERTHEGAVAHVWFARPEVHNALSDELAARLVETLHSLAHDGAVRVVVLGGRGPSFCAGADIAAMKASANATFEQNLAQAEKLAACFGALADFPKPVVGRVHGGVFGGGVGFVCACDIVVSSDEAKFGITEARLGILPGVISPYVIRRLGDRFAREFMLTGERFDSTTALRIGLVHHVTPLAGLDATVDERVGELLKAAPGAQRRIKTLLELWADTGWEEYRSTLPRVLAEVRSGAEARDGLAAFFEKRKPKWMA